MTRTAIVLSVALALALAGAFFLWHRYTASVAEAERQSKRASAAEMRIRSACDLATVHVLSTLYALKETPQIGLTLAVRDASNTRLCGGDGRAIEEAALRDDVEAAFEALLSLYDSWCPSCAERRLKNLQEKGAHVPAAPDSVVPAGVAP